MYVYIYRKSSTQYHIYMEVRGKSRGKIEGLLERKIGRFCTTYDLIKRYNRDFNPSLLLCVDRWNRQVDITETSQILYFRFRTKKQDCNNLSNPRSFAKIQGTWDFFYFPFSIVAASSIIQRDFAADIKVILKYSRSKF